MWEILVNVLETLTNNLEIVMPTLWVCFAVYAIWFFTSAKHYASITLRDVKILWKVHKQKVQCEAKKWRIIKHRKRIIGFECGCGYKHVEKRPII
ncbi:MAG: hypothetical protein OEY95_06815 [Candidatus Bathyarchaeota archaeon]|nr:hypothetical protein [Candidatus Bathyarchaeota archaeon]